MPDDLNNAQDRATVSGAPTRPHTGATAAPPNPPRSFSFLAGLTAQLAIGLMLMGFGVVLAEADRTRLPYGSLFGNPVELISIGSMAVMNYFEQTGRPGFFAELWWVGFSLAVPLATLSGLMVLLMRWPKAVTRIGRRARNWGMRVEAHLRRRSRSKALAHGVATLMVALLVIPSLTALAGFMLTFGAVTCSIPTLLGYKLGAAYIEKMILGSPGCTGDARLNGHYGAACVIVKVKDRGSCRGRIIMGGSSVAVVLDDTHPGKFVPHRIPMADAFIEPAGPDQAAAGGASGCDLH